MTAAWCLAAALAAMLLYGAASVLQAAATRRVSGPRVMAHPLYLVGLGADALAWAASLLALVRLPLFVVQPIMAGSVAVAVLLAVPTLRVRLSRQDVAGVALTTVGLVLVAVCSGPESTADAPGWFVPAMVGGLVGCAALALVWYRAGPGAGIAAVAGLAFAGAALAGRAVVAGADVTSWPGITHLLTDPMAWCVAGYGALGTVTYARALERTGLGTATAVMWVIEAALPGVVGVAALGDAVRTGFLPAAVAGVVLAVAGCVVLAVSPTQEALAE